MLTNLGILHRMALGCVVAREQLVHVVYAVASGVEGTFSGAWVVATGS